MPEDFDRVAVVVDWLDACRTRDLDALLDLYAEDARLECRCEGVKVHRGRAELDAYWRPRLDSQAAVAFGLEEIRPEADGVLLDYRSFEGKPVRVHFSFDKIGKIMQTRCRPVCMFPSGID
ncbi:MAG TPA: nuclear transport factor 2 family protein [Bradyrhizobium sp.]|nr:nuclear transport factor 2 family protein [Bradyrhizobium sp.]